MELLLKAITTYLVSKMCKFLEMWFRQLWSVEEEIEQCEATSEADVGTRQCPLRPIAPRPDYLEAMVGDLLEWQSELQEEGLPTYRIVFLTLWQFLDLLLDVVEITIHNLIVPDPSRVPKPSGDSSDTDTDAEPVPENVSDDSQTI